MAGCRRPAPPAPRRNRPSAAARRGPRPAPRGLVAPVAAGIALCRANSRASKHPAPVPGRGQTRPSGAGFPRFRPGSPKHGCAIPQPARPGALPRRRAAVPGRSKRAAPGARSGPHLGQASSLLRGPAPAGSAAQKPGRPSAPARALLRRHPAGTCPGTACRSRPARHRPPAPAADTQAGKPMPTTRRYGRRWRSNVPRQSPNGGSRRCRARPGAPPGPGGGIAPARQTGDGQRRFYNGRRRCAGPGPRRLPTGPTPE